MLIDKVDGSPVLHGGLGIATYFLMGNKDGFNKFSKACNYKI
jgi:hypothetical protein